MLVNSQHYVIYHICFLSHLQAHVDFISLHMKYNCKLETPLTEELRKLQVMICCGS